MHPASSAPAILVDTLKHQRSHLLALLAVQTRDIAAAEDALGDAIEKALALWSVQGPPDNPPAWLLAVARNRYRDTARHQQVQAGFAMDWSYRHEAYAEAPSATDNGEAGFPDERLKLLFVCAHPAIDRVIHTPLMLQVVMGIPVERMARLFLVKPAALAQRLSRAKEKIRYAGIAFELPTEAALPARLPAVLDAIYGCYSLEWDWTRPEDMTDNALADEALSLAQSLADRLGNPEAFGLLALLLFIESRRGARFAADGTFVPLDEQQPTRWNHALMEAAWQCLAHASQSGYPGRYQLEAAIQSVHAHRAISGVTDWEAIHGLYQGLLTHAPTLGYQLGAICALAKTQGAAPALARLKTLPFEKVCEYQPYWGVLAHLSMTVGDCATAAEAYRKAIELTQNTAVNQFLRKALCDASGETPFPTAI